MQKRLTWIAAIVVAGAASAGIASATARLTAPDAVVHACANTTNGLLRLVDEGASCRENETAVQWHVQGPPGPPGGLVEGAACTGFGGGAGTLSIATAADGTLTLRCTPSSGGGGGGTTAPTLASFTAVTGLRQGTHVPVATITLTSPAVTDTFVAVTSSNATVQVDGGGATVLAGSTNATVSALLTAPGSSTLTATLGAAQLTADIDVAGS